MSGKTKAQQKFKAKIKKAKKEYKQAKKKGKNIKWTTIVKKQFK